MKDKITFTFALWNPLLLYDSDLLVELHYFIMVLLHMYKLHKHLIDYTSSDILMCYMIISIVLL